MKRILVISLALLMLTMPVFSQQPTPKPTPSRAETIAYLNKRAHEAVKLYNARENKYYFSAKVLDAGDDKITIVVEESPWSSIPVFGDCGLYSHRFVTTFKPSQIKEVYDNPSNNEASEVVISLSSSSATRLAILFGYTYTIERGYSGYGYCNTWKEKERSTNTNSVAFMPYLRSDPTNLAKIRKALLHLRDLDKGAADPFGD